MNLSEFVQKKYFAFALTAVALVSTAALAARFRPAQDTVVRSVLVNHNQDVQEEPEKPEESTKIETDQKPVVQAPIETLTHKQVLNSPSSYNLDTIYQTLEQRCSQNDSICVIDFLKEITTQYGPEAASETLRSAQKKTLISSWIDDHQIAHQIGRTTAESFGINGEAFLKCSTAYNYGCQHGFFEYALGRTDSTKDAADMICGQFEKSDSYSPKFKFYCYHGVGHGVMMAQANDIFRSLAICDTFATSVGQAGCWQGAFMENINAVFRHEARQGVFSTADPLSPCNAVENKYRHECYINHSGWLVHVFANDVGNSTSACLGAGDFINSCLQSIGLMVTNPTWQMPLAGNAGNKSFEEIAWHLCRQFPAGYVGQCVFGAVDNVMNFDELNASRARKFCSLVDSEMKDSCYEQIGRNLRNQSASRAVIEQQCSISDERYARMCLRGGGL